MSYLDAYLFSAAGILGVIVLALMGRRHIRLPQGFGPEGTTLYRRRDADRGEDLHRDERSG